MDARAFVQALAQVRSPHVFNPYSDCCALHDAPGAAAVRCNNLASFMEAALASGSDSVWMGRDLGYLGGRRTGLALTSEAQLGLLARLYPGAKGARATRTEPVAERTAAAIWRAIAAIEPAARPFLWNVFPLHPHEAARQMSNRAFRASELSLVDDLNAGLVRLLGVRRIISIGRDAAEYAKRFGVAVHSVRHPSYGGLTEFRQGIGALYGIGAGQDEHAAQAQMALPMD